ncbi:hypothetical protein WG70_31300 [Burkholderia oklahomensis EO147]|uniref:hypothetical protein n=1 Tax=Burkholderia oklahomensis TaxID=342113 RepID=UPI00016A6C0D|nr:hypothetical protein [Burkholderia oklahomensis]AOI43937.1 hypothetical protein WG70_31300 [Burkholderia oklahomensis EO147]KUY49579.1 hypothetical protein WG70_21345 [Burkholderia oklahomensis EO147]
MRFGVREAVAHRRFFFSLLGSMHLSGLLGALDFVWTRSGGPIRANSLNLADQRIVAFADLPICRFADLPICRARSC